MFGPQKTSKEAESVIGPSVKIKGNFGGEGDIVIQGTVEGSLKSSNTIFVNDGARVMAGINAKNAVIRGEAEGNIQVDEHLEIGEASKIKGDVSCSRISIAKGAVFNGKCEMNGSEKTNEHNKV